jgi:hypothetical protein
MAKFGRLKKNLSSGGSGPPEDTPIECTNVGRHSKLILMFGSGEDEFRILPKEKPPEEFEGLVRVHYGRLRALLDKPVILAVQWDEGDPSAVVQIMPADGKPSGKPFEEFTLLFPVKCALQ